MKNLSRVFAFSFLILTAQLSNGEEITLLDAFNLASDSALDINLARYSVDIANANRDVAFGKIMPQVSLFGQWSENRVNYDTSALTDIPAYPGQRYGVQVKQALLNVADSLEVRRLEALAKQSENQVAFAYAQLLSDLTAAFFQITITSKQQAVIQDELVALESRYSQTKALSDKKLVPVTETLETLARRDSLKADMAFLDGKAAVAAEDFFMLVGDRGVAPASVSKRITLPSESISLNEAISLASLNNPTIAIAEEGLNAAREAIRREKSSWIPNIDLSFSYQHADVGFDNLGTPPRDTSIFTVGFNYPIIEGGAGAARLRGVWAEYYGALTRLQFAKRDVEARVRSAWLNKQASVERAKAAINARAAARVSFLASEKALLAGTVNTSDTLDALARRSMSEVQLVRANLEMVVSWIEFQLAIGDSPRTIASTISSAIHNQDQSD